VVITVDGSEIRKQPPLIYETPMKNGIFSSSQLVIAGFPYNSINSWSLESLADFSEG